MVCSNQHYLVFILRDASLYYFNFVITTTLPTFYCIQCFSINVFKYVDNFRICLLLSNILSYVHSHSVTHYSHTHTNLRLKPKHIISRTPSTIIIIISYLLPIFLFCNDNINTYHFNKHKNMLSITRVFNFCTPPKKIIQNYFNCNSLAGPESNRISSVCLIQSNVTIITNHLIYYTFYTNYILICYYLPYSLFCPVLNTGVLGSLIQEKIPVIPIHLINCCAPSTKIRIIQYFSPLDNHTTVYCIGINQLISNLLITYSAETTIQYLNASNG